MIFYNSENSIRDIRPWCRLLFCHNSISLLQNQSRFETTNKYCWICPPTLLARSAPALGTNETSLTQVKSIERDSVFTPIESKLELLWLAAATGDRF